MELVYDRRGLGNDSLDDVIKNAISQNAKKLNLEKNQLTELGIRKISSSLMPNIPLDTSPEKALKSARKQARDLSEYIRGEQVASFVDSMITVEKALSTKSSNELSEIIKKGTTESASAWEASIRSKMQTICNESDAKAVLETIKEHYELDRKRSLAMLSGGSNLFFDTIKAEAMKVLLRNNFTFEYMLYCMTFYHETKGLAESVKSTLVNEMNDLADKSGNSEVSDSLRALFVGRLRDVALQSSPTLSSLTTLRLCQNPIGDIGAVQLAHALRYNNTLQKLYISKCDVGDSGATALSESLTWTNETLKLLDVSNNVITDTGGVNLFSIFESNVTLDVLRVSGNLLLPELESLIETCTYSVNGKTQDQRIKQKIASTARTLGVLLSSGNNASSDYQQLQPHQHQQQQRQQQHQIEDILFHIRDLLSSEKTTQALSYVEQLLYDSELCPTGADKCEEELRSAARKNFYKLDQRADDVSDMYLDDIERSLKIDFSEFKSKTPCSPIIGVSRGRPRKKPPTKYVPFYAEPENPMQLFVNAFGKLTFDKIGNKVTGPRDRYKLYAEAHHTWQSAKWPDRMSVIHMAYPKAGISKRKPRPPTNTTTSIMRYVKKIRDDGQDLSSSESEEVQADVKVVKIRKTKPIKQREAAPVTSDYEEESSLNGTFTSNKTLFSVKSDGGSPLTSPVDGSMKKIPRFEDTDPSVITSVDSIDIEGVTFPCEGEQVSIRLLGNSTLRYFIGSTPKAICRKIDFDGIDSLILPTSTATTVVHVKIPPDFLISTLASLKSLCNDNLIPHNIPDSLERLEAQQQKDVEADEFVAQIEDRLQCMNKTTDDSMDCLRLQTVGQSANKDLEVAVSPLISDIVNIQKTHRLEVVGIPVLHEETFSILRSALLFGFFEVSCRNSDFQTSTPMIMVITNNCVYLYHNNANIERCIHMKRVSHLLLAQDPLKNLHVAICTLPDPGPKYDILFTAAADTTPKIVKVMRGIYSSVHAGKSLAIEKADVSNIFQDVVLLKPHKYLLEKEFVAPTQRGG